MTRTPLIIATTAVVLAGCANPITPKDLAVGELMCASYGGMVSVERSESLRPFTMIHAECANAISVTAKFPRDFYTKEVVFKQLKNTL